jgi:hypothetical protein
VIEQHLATGAVPKIARPQPRPASSYGGRGMWILLWLALSTLARLFNGENGGSSPRVPLTPIEASSSRTASADVAALLQRSEYAGVLSNISKSGEPVRADMKLTFADLKAGGGGYLNVFPPLSGSGPCLLRARPDSVRLSVYSGSDTFNLVGARVADTIIGTYRILGTTSRREYGRWRAWFVGGTRIPARLEPW